MAVQTPITNSNFNSVAGDLGLHLAKFSSVANNDTYLVPMSTILAFSVDPGNSSATVGATWVNGQNGSTITFTVTSGPATNLSLIVYGYR